MELRHLATFVAVAEEQSFSRGAERLHVVQSAVSASVRNLERELGVTLFDRTTHKVELSDAGHALLPKARATLAAADAAREAVDEVRGGLRGTVTLGTMQSHAMHAINVAGVLAAFRTEHPGVELKIRQAGGSSEMAHEVRQGRLDLAFVALPNRAWPGIELVPVAREAMMLAVPREHPLSSRADIELSALQDETFVDLPEGWGTRMASDRSFAAAGVPRTVTYEVNDITSMIEFVRHRLAIGLMPLSFADGLDDLSFVPVREYAPQFVTEVAIPSSRRVSAATRALLETIKRHVGT